MIIPGARVRANVDDGEVKRGWEGVAKALSPGFGGDNGGRGPCWDVDFPGVGSWIIYQSWLDVVDDTPDETEGFFV